MIGEVNGIDRPNAFNTGSTKKTLKIQPSKYKKLFNRNVKHHTYFDTVGFCKNYKDNHDSTDRTITHFDINRIAHKTTNISLPYPVTTPQKFKKFDPCLDLLQQKSKYLEKLDWCLNKFKKEQPKLTKNALKGVDKLNIPQYLYDISQNKLVDPDPNFTGSYNWYYTRGFLKHFTHNGQDYLIRPNLHNELGILNCENLQECSFIHGDSPIFNIECVPCGDNIRIATREKNEVKICDLIMESQDIETKWASRSEIPIVDLKFSPYDEELVLLDAGRNLKIINLDSQANFGIKLPECAFDVSDSLAQFEFFSREVFIFMDRSTVSLLDLRTEDFQNRRRVANGYFTCDECCCLLRSKSDNNFFYLGTRHNILKYDARNMEVVKKWQHLLSHPPLLMKSCIWGRINEEYLVVSSQHHSEKVILSDCNSENSLCKSFPSNLDTLMKTFISKGVSLSEDLKPRLELSTAGLEVVRGSRGLTVYSANSHGDIFAFEVSESLKDVNSTRNLDSTRNLHEWIKALPRYEKPLQVTTIMNMSRAKEMLKNNVREKELEKLTRDNAKRFDLWGELDRNAFELGHIWDEDGGSGSQKDKELPPSINSSYKVSEWLHSTMDDTSRVSVDDYSYGDI